MKEKIGLIGAGSMGTAILEGLLKKRIAAPRHVWVYDKAAEKMDALVRRWKVWKADSVSGLLSEVRIVILAVKPQDLDLISDSLKAGLKTSHVLISILAGTPLKKIRRKTGGRAVLVRAMPNLGARTGHAMTALTGPSPRALKLAEKIFAGSGRTVRLREKFFDLVTAVSGSGPAYFFFLTELLARFGVEHGLSPETARDLAVETAVGAASVAAAAEEGPGRLRAMVTSRGGTTEAAFRVLTKKRCDAILMKAFGAALARGRELARG